MPRMRLDPYIEYSASEFEEKQKKEAKRKINCKELKLIKFFGVNLHSR